MQASAAAAVKAFPSAEQYSYGSPAEFVIPASRAVFTGWQAKRVSHGDETPLEVVESFGKL